MSRNAKANQHAQIDQALNFFVELGLSNTLMNLKLLKRRKSI